MDPGPRICKDRIDDYDEDLELFVEAWKNHELEQINL